MPSNHLILCHPLLPSIFPSIRVFSKGLVLLIRRPKYWSFGFNISPSNEHSGLVSFRMDWLDLLAVQGTLKSLLQHHSSKAPILRRSAFFMVQLSYPYMTTRKIIALTRRTLVGKVTSLLFSPDSLNKVLSPLKWTVTMSPSCPTVQMRSISDATPGPGQVYDKHFQCTTSLNQITICKVCIVINSTIRMRKRTHRAACTPWPGHTMASGLSTSWALMPASSTPHTSISQT